MHGPISLRKLRSFYRDDLQDIHKEKLIDKLNKNTHFSISFIVLLIGSSVVCTLGLLMNTPAVVIGGMIMSPLMWPLMKISIGISFAKQDYVKQAVLLLFFSVLISFLSAFLITYISPLKLVNTEIVARTNPTLLDVFVAVSAGAVAALAMAQKRISESLAGVAVATSLMPPLCVSGIGLALFDIGIFAGGFLLFITNVVSIIFISIFTFIFLGLKSKRKTQFRTESIIFMSGAMLLTAIPLFVFLNNVSFRSTTYLTAEKVLRSEMKEISPGIHVQNIQTTLEREEDIEKVDVQAEILIPEEITLDFEQRQSIIAQLEDELDRKIDLNLLIQKTISLQSEQDKQHDRMRRLLTDTFKEQIEQLDVSFAIDTLSVSIPEDSESWLVDAVLRGDSSVQFTESQRKELEYQLVQASNQAVTLDMEIISRIKLQSAPELENEKIKQDVETFIQGFSDQIDITSVAVQTPADETAGEEARTVRITASLVLPPRVSITREDLSELNDLLSKTYEKEFQIQINTIKKDTVIY